MKTLNITPKEGINRNHRKENNFIESYELLTFENGQITRLATLRIYGTNAKNYCCVWVHDQKTNTYCSGSGSAGGYGYHRPSAAAEEALRNAGIKLDQHIGGRGERAIEDALLSIGEKIRPRNKTINVLKAHA